MYESTFSAVREGDLLAGKYRIERVLGVGGMGVIVAAQHLQLEEKVAIKFLLPTALEHPEAVSRFLREAKAAVRIKSEHVARVSDVGMLDNGSPYMVMEYLDGYDLAQWLRQNGPLSTEQAVEFILQALEAIADAHGLGIVHRDLKPGNLFCVRRSDGLLSIKVLDFGISKVSLKTPTAPQFDMTAPATIMGSPLYMSPEQMRSARDVDTRTDIWSLGVILYELLTGNPPFNGETISEVCVKTAASPPTPIRQSRPEIPVELETVILKCLAKDREDRYANVAELASALAPFGPKRARPSAERISRIISESGLGASALDLPVSTDRDLHSTIARTNGNFVHTTPRRAIGKLGAVLGLCLFGFVSIVMGFWFWRGRNATVSVAPVTSVTDVVVLDVPKAVASTAPPSTNVPEAYPSATEASRPRTNTPKNVRGTTRKSEQKPAQKTLVQTNAQAKDPFGSPH
jgi:serine/threonine-protein kinase